MPKIEGNIKGAIGAGDEVIVSLRETPEGEDIASAILSGPGSFSLEAPGNGKYFVCADEAIDEWAFAENSIAIDATNGGTQSVTFEAVQLIPAHTVVNDEVDRQFVIHLLEACLQNADKMMDERGVQEGRRFIRNTIMEALRKDADAPDGPQAQDMQGIAPQQQQQWRDTGEFAEVTLADEKVQPLDEWMLLPTGERFVRPLFMILCTVCYNRYNTPGTMYYKNATALNTCLYSPPCT